MTQSPPNYQNNKIYRNFSLISHYQMIYSIFVHNYKLFYGKLLAHSIIILKSRWRVYFRFEKDKIKINDVKITFVISVNFLKNKFQVKLTQNNVSKLTLLLEHVIMQL